MLPEDRADEELANGFLMQLAEKIGYMRVLKNSSGWSRVRDDFAAIHVPLMKKYSNRYMVLLVDFDTKDDRRNAVESVIPPELKSRVFVIGVWSEPEDLKKSEGGNFETIGQQLADECRDGRLRLWNHDLLRHNAAELERMQKVLRPILFS